MAGLVALSPFHIRIMLKLDAPDLKDIYDLYEFREKKLFLKSIIKDIFVHKWDRVHHNMNEMLDGDFKQSFEYHFSDPLSQSIMELMEIKEEKEKRQTLVRFGLYHLSKAWRLRNTFSEATNRDTIQSIYAKTSKFPSHLVSSALICNTVENLKKEKLIKPDPNLIQIHSIDNYQMVTKSGQPLTTNKSKKFIGKGFSLKLKQQKMFF